MAPECPMAIVPSSPLEEIYCVARRPSQMDFMVTFDMHCATETI
jgi:hypothetical protein